MHRRQVPQQLMRRLARREHSSSAGRRHCEPTAPSAAASHRHRRRLATSAAAASSAARSPQQYVSGMTSEQLESNEEMKKWFTANFEGVEGGSAGDAASSQQQPLKTVYFEDEPRPPLPDPPSCHVELPEHLSARNIRPLVAYVRRPGIEEGTRNCHRLRNPGVNDPYLPLVPGILHGSDPTSGILSVDHSSKLMVKTPWFEVQKELDRYHHGRNGRFENRVYALTVYPAEELDLAYHSKAKKREYIWEWDEETMEETWRVPEFEEEPRKRTPIVENALVIPRDLQMHPVAQFPFCLNYIRYHPSKPISLPVETVNEEESPAMKRGGFIAFVANKVECLVDEGAPIPESIKVRCDGLKQKDVVRRDRLVLPEGVRIHPRVAGDYLLGTVFGAKGKGGVGSAGDEAAASADGKAE